MGKGGPCLRGPPRNFRMTQHPYLEKMNPMKINTRWLLSAPLALAAAGAWAQNLEAQTRVTAASCATCHGTGGVSTQAAFVSLSGVDRTQLLDKLLAFKKGTLPATVMHQHAKGYSDDELARLADFFSRQKR